MTTVLTYRRRLGLSFGVRALALLCAATGIGSGAALALPIQGASTSIVDVDRDGVPDNIRVVTAPTPAVQVVSGANGAVLATLSGRAGEAFGSATRTFGDINGDGHPELLVYADAATSPQAGAVYLFDLRTGLELWRLPIADTTPPLTGATAPPSTLDLQPEFSVIPDQTGDGVPDVVVGGSANTQGGYTGAVVVLVDGRTGARLALRQMSFAAAVSIVSATVPGRIYRPTDLDGSGVVNLDDLVLYLSATVNGLSSADVNGDGQINSADASLIVQDITDREQVVLIASDSLTLNHPGGLTGSGPAGGSGPGVGGGNGASNALATNTTTTTSNGANPPPSDPCSYHFRLGWQNLNTGYTPVNIEFPFESIRPGPLVEGEDYWFRFREEVRDVLGNGGTWVHGVHGGGLPTPGPVPYGSVVGWGLGAGFVDASSSEVADGLWVPSDECFKLITNQSALDVRPGGGRLRRDRMCDWNRYGMVRVQFWVTIQPPVDPTVPVPVGEQPTLPPKVTLCYSYDYSVSPVCQDIAVERLNTYGRANVCPDVFTAGQAIIVRARVVGSYVPDNAALGLYWTVDYTTLGGVITQTTRTSGGVLRINPPTDTGSIDIRVSNRAAELTAGTCDPNPSEKFTLTVSADADNDGIPDACELGYAQPPSSTRFCTSPTNRDTDGDSFLDGIELALGSDPCNRLSVPSLLGDTDGDGLTDYDEVIVHGTNPNLLDTDGDGASDFAEVELRRWQQLGEAAFAFAPALRGVPLFNPLDARSLGGPLADGFTPAYQAFDRDHDQLFDPWEEMVGLDPSNPDEDGDGVNDGFVLNWGYYRGTPILPRPGVVPPQALDSDNDGIPDDMENALGTDIYSQDSDDDGLPDGYELNNGYNPTGTDTDGNGINDGDEDRDSDGLKEADEYSYGTDANRADTDNDGRSDGWEVNNRRNPTSAQDANTPMGYLGTGMIEVVARISGGWSGRSGTESYGWNYKYKMTIKGGGPPINVSCTGELGGYSYGEKIFVIPVGEEFDVTIERTWVRPVTIRYSCDPCLSEQNDRNMSHSYSASINYLSGNGIVILDDFDYPDRVVAVSGSLKNPIGKRATLYTPRISVRDLRDWGPVGLPSDYPDQLNVTVQNKDLLNSFTRPSDEDRELAGAVTDGVSPCVVRLDYGKATPPPERGNRGNLPYIKFHVVDSTSPLPGYSNLYANLRPWTGFNSWDVTALGLGNYWYQPDHYEGQAGVFLPIKNNNLGETVIPRFSHDELIIPNLPINGYEITKQPRLDRDHVDPYLTTYTLNPAYDAVSEGRVAALYFPPEAYPARGFNAPFAYDDIPGYRYSRPYLVSNPPSLIPNIRFGLDNGEETAMSMRAVLYYYTGPRSGFPHGVRVEAVVGGARPWKLRRPPIVLLHGISGYVEKNGEYYFDKRVWDRGPEPQSLMLGNQITPEELSAEQGPPPILTTLYRVDYRPVNMQGFDKALPYLESTIGRALSDYRSGQASLRSGVREKFAITRVDAVAHSMGGQILKLYISDVQRYSRPSGCDQFTHRTYQYLDPSNWYAGNIRRMVTIGTPHTGSAQANLAWYGAGPPDPAMPIQSEIDRIDSFVSNGAARIYELSELKQLLRFVDHPGFLFPSDSHMILNIWETLSQRARIENSVTIIQQNYRAPNAIRDLSHFSEAVEVLARAEYPLYFRGEPYYDDESGNLIPRNTPIGPKVPSFPIAATVDFPYTRMEFYNTDWLPYLAQIFVDINPDTSRGFEFLSQSKDRWLINYLGEYNSQMQDRQYQIPNLRNPLTFYPICPASLHHLESDGVVNIWSQRHWFQPLSEEREQSFAPMTFHGIGHSEYVVSTRNNVSERETSYRPIGSLIMDRLSKSCDGRYWFSIRNPAPWAPWDYR